jgi:cyanate lyase
VNIENLSQYNPPQFLKLFGLYVQERRREFKLTLENLSASTGFVPVFSLEQIESGTHALTNEELSVLIETLSLDVTDIYNLAKITQVQSLVEVSRELNERFPR